MYLAIFFIVLGLAFAVFAAYITQLGHTAKSWPSVTARKLRDGLEKSRTKSGQTYSTGSCSMNTPLMVRNSQAETSVFPLRLQVKEDTTVKDRKTL